MVPPTAPSSTTQVASALPPPIVNANCRTPFGPSVSEEGETETLFGSDAVTLKLTEFDFERGPSPMGSPYCMNTCAVSALLSKAAGTTAVSCVLLREVVAKIVLVPFTDHTGHLLL